MGAVAGIELPEGNPGAVESAAALLTRAAGSFDSAAGTVRQAEGMVGIWRGMASFTFRTHCGTSSEAARAGGDACQRAATVLRRYGRELEDARQRVRELQRKGEDCVRRIDAADARAGAAAVTAAGAEMRGFLAGLGGGPDAAAATAAAGREADAARAEQAQAQREAEAAREELRRLQERAREERERIEERARAAAGSVRGAAGNLPSVQFPPPPPVPVVEEEDDGGLFGDVMGVVHTGLDGLGFIPAAGAIPDLINAGIYTLEGDAEGAAWSAGAAVPLFGDGAKAGKMIKEGVEAAGKASRAADAARGVVTVGGRQLPAYVDEPGGAKGIFTHGGGDDLPLKSGYDGPSKQLPTDRSTPGMHNNIKSHVEAHAAATMRLEGIQDATLYINRIPCTDERPPGCHFMLERMLPEGATLTVHGPDNFKWTYHGIPDP
jgi:SCP1.201-like deaminase